MLVSFYGPDIWLIGSTLGSNISNYLARLVFLALSFGALRRRIYLCKKTSMCLPLMCDLHLWFWQIRGQLLHIISMANNCYLAIFSRLILLLSCQYRLHNAHVPSRWRPTYRDRIKGGPEVSRILPSCSLQPARTKSQLGACILITLSGCEAYKLVPHAEQLGRINNALDDLWCHDMLQRCCT